MSISVLSFLIRQKNSFTSGQAIAGKLGISRAAVWKAVEALRAEGYQVESVRAKGYRLIGMPDILGEREAGLGLKTKKIGRKIIYFPETDSTNTRAARLAAEGEPEGTMRLADCQSAGRGRGRKWESPSGVNIYMSIILRPKIPPTEAPLTTLVAAVALAKAVRGLYGMDWAGIKWPNDLLLNGRKAAGILTEMSAEPQLVRHIIVGVGIDVNMKKESFPAEIRDISTSLMLELGKAVNRAELLRRFLEEFEHYYNIMVKGGRDKVLDEWRSHSVTLGRRVRISGLKGDKFGIARDIDASGSLILETEGGAAELVTSGDLWFI